jgi:DNA-binding MarR family transcriptional regulator
MSCGQYRIEDSIGYLIARSRTRLAKSLDIALVEYDITHAQGSIVLMLSTGKYATAAELARELYIDSASMTRMVDRLEKRGLIQRVRRKDDRRIVDLELSPDGRALAQALPKVYAGVLARSFAGFSQDEMDTLKGLLRKLLANDMAGDDAAAINQSA